MEMKIILLTGGTGYLGSKILKQLVDNGYNIILLKRSFSNPVRIKEYINKVIFYDIDLVPLERIFSENTIDTIVHCATNYGRGENDPLHVIEANLLLPLKLLELGKKYHVKSFINTDTILDKRINYYSLSKKQFKDWLIVSVLIKDFTWYFFPNSSNFKGSKRFASITCRGSFSPLP
jgi:dTDP-4-dehydrorhamnose reductase